MQADGQILGQAQLEFPETVAAECPAKADHRRRADAAGLREFGDCHVRYGGQVVLHVVRDLLFPCRKLAGMVAQRRNEIDSGMAVGMVAGRGSDFCLHT